MLRLPRMPRLEVEVGCLVPLALMLAVAIAVGVGIGLQVRAPVSGPDRVLVRVIDDGAKPGPKVLVTQVVPLH
jgi:hypothetical protein